MALQSLTGAVGGQKALDQVPALSFLEWLPSKGGFYVKLSETESMSIYKEGLKYRIKAEIKGKRYSGLKDNIEVAFKTLDQLLYKEVHDSWFKVKCSLLLKEFQGEIPNV